MSSPAEIAAAAKPFGVSFKASGGSKHHVVNRRSQKTLCGHAPASIYGVDLRSRRQIDCLRCYKLAFTGVNACTSSTPDIPLQFPGDAAP